MNKKIIKQIGIFLIFTLLHTPIFAEGMIEEEMKEPIDSENETAIELDFSGQGIYSDPFKKGVTRSPAYATFGDDLTAESLRIDDLRHLTDLRHYRVIGIVEDEEMHVPAILELYPDDFFGDEHQAYYVKIETNSDQEAINTAAKNILVNHGQSLNRYLIVRINEQSTQKNYALEYGPFRTKEIAAAHCYYVATILQKKDMECHNVHFHYVSDQEKPVQQNTASLGLSQFALLDIKEKSYDFNLEKLKKVSIDVTVDELLGPYGFHITNINADGVSVTGLSGNAMFIPVSTFPVGIENSSPSQKTNSETSLSN